MLTRKEVEKRIARLIADENDLRKQQADLRVKVAQNLGSRTAYQEMLKSFPTPEDSLRVKELRPGSAMAKARDAIKQARRPLHIAEIIKAIGAVDGSSARTSLAGSLSAYSREHRFFTKPAPNTFGLIEAESTPILQAETESETPKNVVNL